jgi:TDG/mug DNA glycosylase family protein
VDRRTQSIYDTRADEWIARRRATALDEACEFGAATTGPTADLGCGPGWYTSALAAPVVALDGSLSMLRAADATLAVQADLEALPLRTHALGAAWARNSYVHVGRGAMPLALADLHRCVRVGGRVQLQLFAGDDEGYDLFENDDFPGRFFSRWDTAVLADVVRGAGFDLDDVAVRDDDRISVSATRARTLPDYVRPGLALLLCGLNPSLRAADAGVGFVSPSNRFWPAAIAAGIVTRPRDPWHAVREHAVGFTDLVKRASPSAAEVRPDEYRDGFARVERLVAWLQPAVVCFVGLAGWRAAVDRRAVAGWQERRVGGRPTYVMPNPSGLNAHSQVPDLAAHLRAAVA